MRYYQHNLIALPLEFGVGRRLAFAKIVKELLG